MIAFILATILLPSQGIGEVDRIATAKLQHTNQLRDFKTFKAMSLNGDYSPKIQATIEETLKPYGVKWAAQSKTVPVIYVTFDKKSDPFLPKGFLMGTLTISLQTDLSEFKMGAPQRLIRHGLGMSPVSFVAPNDEAAEKRAIDLITPFMKRLGELWKESRTR